jgi:hypothetical protein
MRRHIDIDIYDLCKQDVTIRYKGYDLRRIGLISTNRYFLIINKKYMVTNELSVKHVKYHVDFTKHFKTYWGAKRSLKQSMDFYKPSVVYR